MADTRRPRKSCQRSFPTVCTIASVALACSPYANAAEWRISPGLDLRETYTDNLALDTLGAEQSDFVTEVSPHISLVGEGHRLKFNAMYAMRHFMYARSDYGSTTFHQLSAAANAELVSNLFFVDGKASTSPQSISAFGPQVADRGNVTDNRADVKTFSISPYLQHRFGSTASTELRYTHDSVSSNAGGLLDSQSDRVLLRMDSGAAFRTLQWGWRYDDQRIEYDNAAPVDMRTLSGNVRYLISPRFSLDATAGYEKNNYISIAEKPEGSFWTLGATWSPSEITSISGSAGKRYFGDTWSLAASHRTRLTNWSLAYYEDVTTARSQFQVPVTIDTSAFLNQLWSASFPDPVVRQQFVDAFIREMALSPTLSQPVNSFTNRVFLQKSIQASAAFSGVRNTLIVSLFRTLRDPQSPRGADAIVPGAIDDSTKQVGAQVTWNFRITPRSHANVSTGYTRVTARTTDRKDEQLTMKVGLTRQFQPKLKGGVELRRLEQKTNIGRGDIRENALTAFLSLSF